MDRCLALLGALLLSLITVASACTAAPAEWIHFTLEPDREAIDSTSAFGATTIPATTTAGQPAFAHPTSSDWTLRGFVAPVTVPSASP